MYCKNCGNKLNEGESFCTECGTPCRQHETPPPSSQNQPKNISLVIGIIACCLCFIPFLSIPLAIVSIIIGKEYKKTTGNKTAGTTLGTISLILSILVIILSILAIVFFINWVEEYEETDNYQEKIYDYYNQAKESFDIKGYSWTGNDNSVLYLNKDLTYTWYQNDTVHNDNYYSGTYRFYTGDEAIAYITINLEEYGLTREEQEDVIENRGADLEDYYLIILNCEKTVVNGTESSPENNTVYYYGLYEENRQYLDLVNMNTGNIAGFTLNKRISNIDL